MCCSLWNRVSLLQQQHKTQMHLLLRNHCDMQSASACNTNSRPSYPRLRFSVHSDPIHTSLSFICGDGMQYCKPSSVPSQTSCYWKLVCSSSSPHFAVYLAGPLHPPRKLNRSPRGGWHDAFVSARDFRLVESNLCVNFAAFLCRLLLFSVGVFTQLLSSKTWSCS